MKCKLRTWNGRESKKKREKKIRRLKQIGRKRLIDDYIK